MTLELMGHTVQVCFLQVIAVRKGPLAPVGILDFEEVFWGGGEGRGQDTVNVSTASAALGGCYSNC